MISICLSILIFLCSLQSDIPKHQINQVNNVQTEVFLPVTYDENKPNKFVVYFHGAGGKSSTLVDNYLFKSVLDDLLENGYIVIASDYSSPQSWGNPKSVSETKDLIDFYKKKLNLEENPYILAGSMGGIVALNSIAHGAIHPKAVIALYPVTNLENMYGSKFSKDIEAAYEFNNAEMFKDKTNGYDPVHSVPIKAFVDIPIKIWSSYADTVVTRKDNTDLFAKLVNLNGGNVEVIDSTGDHGDKSNFHPSEVVSFFNGH